MKKNVKHDFVQIDSTMRNIENTFSWGLVTITHTFWMINYGQNWFEKP